MVLPDLASRSRRGACGARRSAPSSAAMRACRATRRGSARTHRGRCRGSRSRRRATTSATAPMTRRVVAHVELAPRRARTTPSATSAVASPSTDAIAPATIIPSTPRHGRDAAVSRVSRTRGTASATMPTRSAAPESAAKSAEERNDACRRPTVPARKMFGAEELRDADDRRERAPEHERPERQRARRAVRRSRSAADGASSAYSANFAAVTPCVRQG